MDVKVEFSLYVMGAEFAEAIHQRIVNTWLFAEGTASNLLGFIPGDNI